MSPHESASAIFNVVEEQVQMLKESGASPDHIYHTIRYLGNFIESESAVLYRSLGEAIESASIVVGDLVNYKNASQVLCSGGQTYPVQLLPP